MNYFTKEYYTLVDASCLGADLIASPSAKRRSENYFRHLYEERLNVWRKEHQEKAAEQGVEYDDAYWTAEFEENYNRKCREYETMLPADLLAQVADVRVLALGCSSSKVKQLIGRFAKEKGDAAAAIEEAYQKDWDKRVNRYPTELVENYGFDYCAVTAIGRDGDNVVMQLDNSQCFDDVSMVIWKGAEIVTLEDGVVGSRWLESELYRTGSGWEFHAILEDEAGGKYYLTVAAQDAEFIIDEEKRKKNQELFEQLERSGDLED